jgi:ADP-ribose pyrophosphatase YjhB (NUDIX family)
MGSERPRLWPRCGASAAIFRGSEVLLVERGKEGAYKGYWSLPGGHIEPGEPARSAALREVREETGVEGEIAGLVDIHEVMIRGRVDELLAHYLIAVFFGRWTSGEPMPAGDAVAARFVALTDLERYPLTDGAAGLIRRGWAILQGGADTAS